MSFQPKRVLVATDFSPCSRDAVDVAYDLAKTYVAHLTVLHVVPPATYLDYFTAFNPQSAAALGYEAAVSNAVERSWRDERARLGTGGVIVEFVTRTGPPAQEVASFGQGGGFGLIVIGTHGRTGLKHVLLGSVAEGVVRHSQVPVLTVRPAPASTAGFPPAEQR